MSGLTRLTKLSLAMSAATAALAIFSPGALAQAHAQQASANAISLESQDLSSALRALARQTGTQIVFDPGAVQGIRAPAVTSAASPEQALAQLLANSGLRYRSTGRGTYTILAQADAPPTRLGDASDAASSEEEIVVTAQRREESLQDVPISISVLGGAELDASTVQGLTEALARVPGVATPVALQGGGTQLSIRGVSTASPVFTGSSAIAYYLDSVPFALVKHAIAPDVDAYDLERVEVLRGPQGTLYGAGSLNGVVRVLTNNADLHDFEFKTRELASSTEDGGVNGRVDMALNLPLVTDRLAVRGVVSYSDLSGWIDRPTGEDANDAQTLNLRLRVNAQPTDRLSIGLSAWASNSDYGAPSFSGDGQTYPATFAEPISTDYYVFGARVAYEFPAFTLTSATSYLDYDSDSLLDQTQSGIPGYHLETRFSAETFAQEFALVSTSDGPWRWSLGGIYRDSTDRTFQNGNMFFVVPQDDEYHSESFAVFGEVTRSLFGESMEVTAGARYFQDKLTQREIQLFTGAPPAGIYARATFDNISPRVVLTWFPSEEATIYASYSEGFRSGLQHTPTILATNPSFQPTEPDTLSNYEIGAKGNFFDRRLSLEGAVYYIDWQDIQQSLRVPITSSVILSTVVNNGSASGMGAEFGVTASPIDKLDLGLSVSWNDLRFDSDVFSGGVLAFSEGDRLNFSPEFTVGASASYTFPLGVAGYEGTLSASANYTSKIRSRRLAGAVLQISDGDPMLLGRTSFVIDSPHGWSASLFADNIGNEDGAFINNWLGVGVRDMRIRPRTIGVQFEYRLP